MEVGLDMIEALESHSDTDHPFGNYEEEAIVSLIIDSPEFFVSTAQFLRPELFNRVEVQYVIAHIMKYYDEYRVFPTRGILLDIIKKGLTVDSYGYEDIVSIVKRPSNAREIPAIKDSLMLWVRSKAYGLLYDTETIAKYKNHDFDAVEQVFNQARNIQDIGSKTLWFFDSMEKLFQEDNSEKMTTGFMHLDHHLNDGGPRRKEMLIFMAPTGVGKSIALVNVAIANVLAGRRVLYVTLEMSDISSAIRALGVITNKPIKHRFEAKDEIIAIINKLRGSGEIGDLAFHELQPDSVSVDAVSAIIDNLKRTKAWVPDVVCIDYLELLLSRLPDDNKDGYSRQKGVATQIRGLASKENVLVFSATQTNRSGNTSDIDSHIDVTKIAESYGKSMPMDYLVSINQTEEEYNMQYDPNDNMHGSPKHPAPARMYIAKNRTGAKFISVPVEINYLTMAIKESM